MSGTQTPTSNSALPTASGYFIDQKKGEVNELKQVLKNFNVERDVKKKREIIKKVIAYMTLGIDVSRLFTDMIMAIETRDIVVKKMVYLYLCNYAHKQPDMAIMCINSLRRDCDNEDPMVRGLALRSLCNLRLESILEYVAQPLQKSLNDLSPYVRKTGVMGILKINGLSPSMVETNGYVGQLYRMLNDGDANVVTNAIVVLNEILIAKGGIELTQSIVMNLLNRIGEFSEWGLNTILDLVARYNPISEDETFAIMNLLDPVLRTANSGAVLATFKCFMKLTSSFPELQPQIYARAKPPMLTLITGSNFEVQFTMLKHLEVLLTRSAAAGIFDSEFRHFFVRYNEPSHVKYLKIELLPLISNDANAKEIAVELGEYVTDVDSELSKRSINAIGKIAMRVASVSPELTQTLLDLVDLDIHYVRAQAVKILSSVIRVFPAVRVHMLPVISKCLRRVEDYEAKATLIWMLGEYGQEIVEAPYLLESIIDNYDDEQSDLIKLHVLTAGMKLFFKRPPEMRAMLGRLFVSAVNDTLSQDVHDRALLYYRLLTADLLVAGSLFNSHSDTIRVEGGQFAEDKDDKTKSKIYCEFNTLAIIFGTPSDQFIAPPYQLKVENLPIIDAAFEPRVQVEVSKDTPILQVHQSSGPVASGVDLLLDFGDTAIAAPVIQKSPFVLVEISPQQFQQLWMSLPESWSGQVCMLRSLPSAASEIEASFRAHNIKTVASGPLQGRESGFKFFLCTFEQDDLLTGTKGSPLLIQLSINTSNNTVNGVLKTAGASSHALISHISYSLRNWS